MTEREEHYLIKTATRRLIKAAGGIEGAATLCRVGKSNLSDYQSINRMDVFMPLDVAYDLERETGCNAVTIAMARVADGSFLPMKRGNLNQCLPSQMAHVLKETGDVIGTVGLTMGRPSPLSAEERSRLSDEIDEAVRALLVARTMLDDGVGQ